MAQPRHDVTQWTAERVAELVNLWNAGLTGSQIGVKLSCTRNAVIGKAHRLGLIARPNPIGRKSKKYKPQPAPKPARLDAKFAPRKATHPVPANDPEPVRIDRTRGCRWVTTDAPPHAYCDAPVQHGTSWCPEHRARCYQPGTAIGATRMGPQDGATRESRKHFNKRTDAKWGQP